MTQLILDATDTAFALPESIKGGYTASRVPLMDEVEMITGRLVREIRGYIWEISYQYGYFSDADKNILIAVCEKGNKESITCGFLPPNSSGDLIYSKFWLTFEYPKFMWSRDGEPIWADFNLTLREVKPSD